MTVEMTPVVRGRIVTALHALLDVWDAVGDLEKIFDCPLDGLIDDFEAIASSIYSRDDVTHQRTLDEALECIQKHKEAHTCAS
jgi:hypothetical protein